MAYEIKKYNEYTWMIEDQLSEVSLTRFFLLEYQKCERDW